MTKALLLINVKGWLWKMNNASKAHFDGWKTLARIRTWRNIWILSPLNIQQTEKNSCHFQVKGWMSEYLWSQKFMSSSWKIRNGDTFWFLPSQRCPQKTWFVTRSGFELFWTVSFVRKSQLCHTGSHQKLHFWTLPSCQSAPTELTFSSGIVERTNFRYRGGNDFFAG